MEKEVIAVYTISNTIAIAITEINYTDDTIEWVAVVGNEALEAGISKLERVFDPDCEELYKQFFYVGAMAIPMDECIRV